MIISHKHKYLFVELPMTGSTAIARELIEHYDGEKILFKHASPKHFWKQATEEEKKYFMFSGIRNPFDQAVSRYFKYKTDHNENFTGKFQKKPHVKLHRRLNRWKDQFRYAYITKKQADFGQFFERFYRLPYNNWSAVWHKHMDEIIRFEHLNDDFKSTLLKIGIEPVRDLPKQNKTSEKKGSFWDFYNTPELQKKSVNVFGAFMKKWDYQAPDNWSTKKPGLMAKLTFPIVNRLRIWYWQWIR